ncbi:LptA/OstA family protein [Methyloligella solikamskensis]|uniref:LptA/OstA family protein n=1 Tax=Methyloligella solikamskensis TaxID=1177756 RepID=A0ABW3J5F3_9HYPH
MMQRRQTRKARTIRSALAVAAGLGAIFLALSAPATAQTITSSSGAVGAKPGAFKGLSKNSDQPIDIASEKLTVYDAEKVAVFTGNVRAVQGDSVLTTTRLDVFYKGSANPMGNGPTQVAEAEGAQTQSDASDQSDAAQGEQGPGSQLTKIEAKGNVKIKSADNQSTKGDHLLYDVEAQTVTLTGNVLIESDKDQKTRSETAVYDMTDETVTVRGNVELSKGKDQTAHSDWAIYDVPGELVTVGGNVVLTQGQNVLKGNKLVINLATGESRFENTGNAAANNRIRALFMPNEGGKGKKKKGKSGEADEEGGPTPLFPPSN